MEMGPGLAPKGTPVARRLLLGGLGATARTSSAAGFPCRSQWIRHIAFLVFPQTSDAFVSWEGHSMELLLLDHVYG